MQLQKRKVGKYKDQQYYQYCITLSPAVIKELKWKSKTKLAVIVEEGKILKIIKYQE